MSGEATTTEAPTTEVTPAVAEGAKPEDTLGDAGKKALEAERAARAKAETDYKVLAAKLTEIEDRDKTAEEKAAKRLAEAEKGATAAEARANRAEVAATTSVPVAVLAGPESSSAEDIAKFAALVTAYATEASKKTPTGPVIPGQGTQPASAALPADDFLRASARG